MKVCLENDDAAARVQPVRDSEMVKGTPLLGRRFVAALPDDNLLDVRAVAGRWGHVDSSSAASHRRSSSPVISMS